jgi:hypothetical protein
MNMIQLKIYQTQNTGVIVAHKVRGWRLNANAIFLRACGCNAFIGSAGLTLQRSMIQASSRAGGLEFELADVAPALNPV